MTPADPLPRPPRRRINGVTWVFVGEHWPTHYGIVGSWLERPVGLAMGCVKDDDGQLPDRFTEEAG